MGLKEIYENKTGKDPWFRCELTGTYGLTQDYAEWIEEQLTICDVSSSVFLVQHKKTLINYGLFSDREKAENYINKNTDLFKIQEIEIA